VCAETGLAALAFEQPSLAMPTAVRVFRNSTCYADRLEC